jgi:hypothetical protein
VNVGDLVMVGYPPLNNDHSFVSIVTAICLPEDQVNGMYLIKVLEKEAGAQWYPATYIEVINEAR